jgi:hypothetical protein
MELFCEKFAGGVLGQPVAVDKLTANQLNMPLSGLFTHFLSKFSHFGVPVK